MTTHCKLIWLISAFITQGFAWGSPHKTKAISIEVGGKSVLYSVGFDKFFGESLAVGVGLSYTASGAPSVTQRQFSIPIVSYLYFNQHPRLFIAQGFTATLGLLTVDGTVFGGIVATGFVGLGFEYESNGGFLFRIAPYVLISNVPQPWAGVTFGWVL